MNSIVNENWRRSHHGGRGLAGALARRLRLWPLLTLFLMSGLASVGDCQPEGARQQFRFDFNAQFDSPDDNAPRRIMPNAYHWDLGRGTYYSMRCVCEPDNLRTPFAYYTATSNLRAGYRAIVEGKSMQFFQINRNLQVAGEVWISARRQEFVPIPFTNESNGGSNPALGQCDFGTIVFRNAVDTGSEGKLHLMIDQPFIGESIIPSTQIVQLTAGLSSHPSGRAVPVAEVWMSGRVVVPQSCRLAAGQNTVIDFGTLMPSEILRAGQAPQRAESRTFRIQCENIGESVLIDLSLSGAPHVREPGLLAVNARDDLAIALRSGSRSIAPLPPTQLSTPAPNQRIPIDLNQPQQQASFDLEAYPVRMAEQLEAGPFASQVTLKFEFR
jgi:type 1 fimbria pilin